MCNKIFLVNITGEDTMFKINIESEYNTDKHLIRLINDILQEIRNNNPSSRLPKSLQSALTNSNIYIEEYVDNIDVSFNPVDEFTALTTFSINKHSYKISSDTIHSIDYGCDNDYLNIFGEEHI